MNKSITVSSGEVVIINIPYFDRTVSAARETVAMHRDDDALAREIRNRLSADFINADIRIEHDSERDEYFVSTPDRKLYHSDEYGTAVFEIHRELWNRGVFNFCFVLDRNGHGLTGNAPPGQCPSDSMV